VIGSDPVGKNLLKVSKITFEQRPGGLCSNVNFADFEQGFSGWGVQTQPAQTCSKPAK